MEDWRNGNFATQSRVRSSGPWLRCPPPPTHTHTAPFLFPTCFFLTNCAVCHVGEGTACIRLYCNSDLRVRRCLAWDCAWIISSSKSDTDTAMRFTHFRCRWIYSGNPGPPSFKKRMRRKAVKVQGTKIVTSPHSLVVVVVIIRSPFLGNRVRGWCYLTGHSLQCVVSLNITW